MKQEEPLIIQLKSSGCHQDWQEEQEEEFENEYEDENEEE